VAQVGEAVGKIGRGILGLEVRRGELAPATGTLLPMATALPPVTVLELPNHHVHYRFFDVMVDKESGRYLSEDYGFCRLWEALGGEIHVDANSNLSHLGERTYRGDFGATLRAAPAHAVGAPKGQIIRVLGTENLKPNP
jgi:hypothetical protein